jgi:hypothetical protein
MTDLVEVDPREYVSQEPSFESLVLGFRVHGETIDLVIDYAWDYEIRPRGTREFRWLQFAGCRDFSQTEIRGEGRFGGKYRVREDVPGSHVVTLEQICRERGHWRAEYCLTDLGCFEFGFGNLRVAKLPTRSDENESGDTIYRDEDGEVVDFYDPFGHWESADGSET